MSWKRSRATFESELATHNAPFVFFGTPVSQATDASGGGSYVPLHNQEVRDDRGRRRLHGAFTGGWSAGYFNTVGSKEGWTPSQFKSSSETRQDSDTARVSKLPQDFMDEEDLADAAESQKLGTSQSFTGIGGRQNEISSTDRLTDLLSMKTDTAGVVLLKKMGWRHGQGIGPKVKRMPRLESTGHTGGDNPISMGSSYLFAPDDTTTIPFYKKSDRSGLGMNSDEGLPRQRHGMAGTSGGIRASVPLLSGGIRPTSHRENDRLSRRGFGVGVLNDSSSGEDDPYEIGPKITQIQRVRNQKAQKRPSLRGQRASIGNQLPKRIFQVGHAPLGGFVMGTTGSVETHAASHSQSSYLAPASWVPSRRAGDNATGTGTRVQFEPPSQITPNSITRAIMLGESGTAKHQLSASPAGDRPFATGESRPQPTRQAAKAALKVDQEGRGLYRSQPPKQARYRRYLEYHAGDSSITPTKPHDMSDLNFAEELEEFYKCAAIFKPMAAPMASRFTAAASSTPCTGNKEVSGIFMETDAPREAAKMGMFGNMTRSVADFTPCNLLCKRFNVKPPFSNSATPKYPDHSQALVHRVNNTGEEEPDPEPKDPSIDRGLGNRSVEEPPSKAGVGLARSQRPSEQVFSAIFGDEE